MRANPTYDMWTPTYVDTYTDHFTPLALHVRGNKYIYTYIIRTVHNMEGICEGGFEAGGGGLVGGSSSRAPEGVGLMQGADQEQNQYGK